MAEESLKQKTKKGIFWSFISQFTNNGLQFVVGIIMARLLSPSDYGVTALPAIFIAIASVFVDSGFTAAMVRKPVLKECDLSTAFIYSTIIGVICYFLLFIGAPCIADFYNEPVLIPLIRVTALSFLWGPLATPQNILLQRKLDFKTPARIAILTKIIGAIVGITFAYLGYGLWALVVMGVLSSFLAFALTWFEVKWKPITGWSKDSFKYLWGYGNKMIVVSFIDQLYNNLSPIIIGKYYSVTSLGIYNRAKGYADLPSIQGTNVIKQVTFPVLSKLQDDNEALARNYRRILKLSAFIIFPVMTMLSALATPFVILLITDKWMDAIILLKLICFSAMWYPVHAINLNLLQVKGRSDLFLKVEIYKKGISLIFMICTLPFGIVYFVSAGIVSSLICLFINTYYTGKLINIGFLTQMRDLLPTLILSLFAFTITICMNIFVNNLWIQLFVGGILGTSFYFVGAYIFNFDELKDVKYMFNRND